MNLVTVISTRISEKIRLIKFRRYGKDDIQECENVSQFGDDSNAPKDMVAVYSSTGEVGQAVIIGYINNKELKAEPGEKRLFSLKENGTLSQYVWLKNDGTMEIGGDADNMVRYSKLETAFNELKSDLNSLSTKHNTLLANFNSLVSVFSAHVHISNGPAVPTNPTLTPGVPSTATSVPSVANIAPAKIQEIKTS